MKYLAIFPLFFCFAGIVKPQASHTRASCNCVESFENLVSKVESNYVGYHIETRGKRDAEYRRFVSSLRKRAQDTTLDKCIFVLQELMGFFRDGHMFVQENPKLSDEDVIRLTASAEQTGRGEEDIRRYLDSNVARLDPIEGIWFDNEGHRFGIVRDHKPNIRDFVAILLSKDVERWLPGQVKAEFGKVPDGSYTDVFYSGRHFPLHLSGYTRGEKGGAALRRDGLLLHIAPISWGKVYPLKPNQQGMLDSVDPRRPTIRALDDSTVVVSVPSHSPEYAPLLKELVEKFRDRIFASKTLIIDIRGDEGGSSWMTDPLMPFLVTPSKRQNRYWKNDREVVLSSPDNIAYFEQMMGQGWIPKRLPERMRANPGKIIPFADPDRPAAAKEPVDVEARLPRNVAILMDRAVVSAGESFVISAMKNQKVTLFGENTGGVIDYQSIAIVPVPGCSSLGFNFGYPTSAASSQLPLGGVNTTGIPPDIRIGRHVKNPIGFIINYYAKRRR